MSGSAGRRPKVCVSRLRSTPARLGARRRDGQFPARHPPRTLRGPPLDAAAYDAYVADAARVVKRWG